MPEEIDRDRLSDLVAGGAQLVEVLGTSTGSARP
jgi:hypothetical protein